MKKFLVGNEKKKWATKWLCDEKCGDIRKLSQKPIIPQFEWTRAKASQGVGLKRGINIIFNANQAIFSCFN